MACLLVCAGHLKRHALICWQLREQASARKQQAAKQGQDTQGQERLPVCAKTNYSGYLQCPEQQAAMFFFGILSSLLLSSLSGALEAFRLEAPSAACLMLLYTTQPGVKEMACHASCCVALVCFNYFWKALYCCPPKLQVSPSRKCFPGIAGPIALPEKFRPS